MPLGLIVRISRARRVETLVVDHAFAVGRHLLRSRHLHPEPESRWARGDLKRWRGGLRSAGSRDLQVVDGADRNFANELGELFGLELGVRHVRELRPLHGARRRLVDALYLGREDGRRRRGGARAGVWVRAGIHSIRTCNSSPTMRTIWAAT